MIRLVTLKERLIRDVRRVGVKADFSLTIRSFAKNEWGYFDPNTNTIVLYAWTDNEKAIKYSTLLGFLLHECVHCEQWSDPEFKRYKGIMHDTNFYEILNKYMEVLKE